MFRMAADWIYGIVAVLLFGAVALQALPEGTYQKYARLFLGGILLLAVLSPVLSLFGLSQNNMLYYTREIFSVWLGGENIASTDHMKDEWQKKAEEQKEAAWGEPLQILAEEYGFLLMSYSIVWDEEGAQPEKLTLTVAKQEESHENSEKERFMSETVEKIEPVEEIRSVGENAKQTESDDGTYYEPSEVRKLHQALETVMGISQDQVVIYWNREDRG